MKTAVLIMCLASTTSGTGEINNVSQEIIDVYDPSFISRDYGEELWTIYDFAGEDSC